jgi:hypothetical protein
MMEKRNLYTKIFRQLRGYFITPHLTIWKGLRNRLFNKNIPDPLSQLKDFRKEPPAELFNRVLQTHQQIKANERFLQLKDFAIQPADDLFDKVFSLAKQRKNKPQGILYPFHKYKKGLAAAALIILLFTCYFIFKTTSTEHNSTDSLVNKTPVIAADSIFIKDTNNNEIQKQRWTALNNIAGKQKRWGYFNASNQLSFYNANIFGNNIPVENSDLLFSFVNYPFTMGQAISWNEKKGNTIRINAYTNIKISPFMVAAIADLYKVKRNGRPTAKARKAKIKIRRWRKTDIKTFDKKKNRNPLDIIDLGENVY